MFQCVFPSAIRCRTVLLLLCCLIVGIHASGISIPLSLLMLLRSYVNRLFDPTCVPMIVILCILLATTYSRLHIDCTSCTVNLSGLTSLYNYTRILEIPKFKMAAVSSKKSIFVPICWFLYHVTSCKGHIVYDIRYMYTLDF